VGKKLELAIAVLNGAVGDYLVRRGNGLATELSLVHGGNPIALATSALELAYPEASPRVVLLVHGLMCSESIFEMSDGTDYGSRLEAELGITPLYLRYNSGLPIADNGAGLARLLERLVDLYPVPIEEIVLIGFSMGGLVVRSACHVAAQERHRWLSRVRRSIYLGTPHRGAPLERGGRVLTKLLASIPDPYTRLLAELGDLRSAGVQDLGDAELRHEDRARRAVTLALTDPAHPVPLLPGMRHYLVAATVSAEPWIARLFGDTIVPIESATNGVDLRDCARALAPSNLKILPGATHVSLAHDPHVHRVILQFLEDE
jgi:triacylglycerol lipase